MGGESGTVPVQTTDGQRRATCMHLGFGRGPLPIRHPLLDADSDQYD